MRESQS